MLSEYEKGSTTPIPTGMWRNRVCVCVLDLTEKTNGEGASASDAAFCASTSLRLLGTQIERDLRNIVNLLPHLLEGACEKLAREVARFDIVLV